MLVLSRKRGEAVHIGNDIKITVLEIQGRRVRIGIEAPHDCRIVRGELQLEADPADVAEPSVEFALSEVSSALPFLTGESVSTECGQRPIGDVRSSVYSVSFNRMTPGNKTTRRTNPGSRRPLKSK